MNLRTFRLWIYFGGLSCVLLSACCKPIFYKPAADPSAGLVDIKFPALIDTVSDIAFDKMQVINDPDARNPRRELKEIVKFSRAEPSDRSITEYRLEVYYETGKAQRSFVNELSFEENMFRNIFIKRQSEHYSYFISYIERPRSDVASLCTPMDYYTQSALFCFGNLVIDVKTRSRKFSKDLLASPISYIAEKFKEHFAEE